MVRRINDSTEAQARRSRKHAEIEANVNIPQIDAELDRRTGLLLR